MITNHLRQREYLRVNPRGGGLEKTGNSTPELYYLHRDYLGSITQITNNNGSFVDEYSYDAWGRMRNINTWQPYAQGLQPTLRFGRGYTGHEHLNEFGIINMNARLYDPVLGRFYAADPLVSSGMTNDFNRYIYCRNNPMMYTDPSGMSFKDWWNRNIAEPFMAAVNRTFGFGQPGFQLGYNSAGGFFANPTYNGMPFGPSGYYNPSNGQTSFGNGSGGFHDNTSSVRLDKKFQQSVVHAEQYAREVYSQANSFVSDYKNRIDDWVGNQSKTFEDIRVFKINSLGESGITLPGVIFLGPTNYDNINILRHEYGHILQYRQWGLSTSLSMMWDSFQSARTYENNPREHMETWTEWSANKLAYDHFGQPSDWLIRTYIVFPTHIRTGSFPSFINVPSDFLFNYFKK